MALNAASSRSSGRAERATQPAGSAPGMSFIHAPTVPFRAHRSYLHSTTLYKEIIAGAAGAGLNPDGPIELRVRRLMRRQPELHYSRSPLPLADVAPAVFSLSAGGATWQLHLAPRHRAVLQRFFSTDSKDK